MNQITSDSETACGECGTVRELVGCVSCGSTAALINCGHYSQPRPIAAGLADGTYLHNTYCARCAAMGG